MARIINECNPCDQGHYGSSSMYCSDCGKDLEEVCDKCPHCGAYFDEEMDFKISDGFGGHDFI